MSSTSLHDESGESGGYFRDGPCIPCCIVEQRNWCWKASIDNRARTDAKEKFAVLFVEELELKVQVSGCDRKILQRRKGTCTIPPSASMLDRAQKFLVLGELEWLDSSVARQ